VLIKKWAFDNNDCAAITLTIVLCYIPRAKKSYICKLCTFILEVIWVNSLQSLLTPIDVLFQMKTPSNASLGSDCIC